MPEPINDQTKARLLDAAGEEFAARGFEGATIRTISQRAGANVAAVNYHFGDKESLYAAALIHAHECNRGELDWSEMEVGTPEERLGRFVRQFLGRVMGRDESNTWRDALMFREMIEPTRASDLLVRDAIRPQFEWLMATLRLLAPEADERRLYATAFSVVGQCLHYKFARPISVRLVGPEAYGRLDVEYLTGHITGLVLAGIGHGSATDQVCPAVGERGGASCPGLP